MSTTLRARHGNALGRQYCPSWQRKPVTPELTSHRGRGLIRGVLGTSGSFEECAKYIQELLGHKSSKTTEIYTHVSRKGLGKITSPLDSLMSDNEVN